MAVDIFIKIGDIEGESIDSVHAKKIDVLAWSWGMSQSGTTHWDRGGGAGKANVQDLSFTHYIDGASNALMIGLHKGNTLRHCGPHCQEGRRNACRIRQARR